MKHTLIWFNLKRDETGNGLSNIKDTFEESLQLQMSVLNQNMCIFKSGLSGLYDGLAKYKEKVPDVSDPNQNVETTCNSKLKFTRLKSFIHRKGAENLKDAWTICTYVANIAILNLRIFGGRYSFRLWIFASTSEYFYYWHWRVLPKVF